MLRSGLVLLSVLALSACGSLPEDGPSTGAVNDGARKHINPSYALVDLDYAATQQIATHPPQALVGLARDASDAPTDLIAEGDVLGVTIFEAQPSLFGRTPSSAVGFNAVGDQQTLPRAVVDSAGNLAVPFAGPVHVAGLRPSDAAEAIRRSLRGRSVGPQVTVSVLESKANSVTVIGQVRAAGHFPITPHNDRLLDVIASAGGPTKPPADLAVVVFRGAVSAEAPLSLVINDPAQNIRLAPQDQIRVLDRPRKYNTFGAVARAAQTPIEDDTLTLAGALSRAGGLDTYSANAAEVMLFRFERPEVARALGVNLPVAAKGVPIIYRLNLRKPDGFFIANNFNMQADDILYTPRSGLTETNKFLTLINNVTQVGYNIRATSQIVP